MAVVVIAVVLLAVDPWSVMGASTTPNDLRRFAGWGIPSALVLIAAVSGPVRLSSRLGQFGGLLGDSSYALYLFHPYVLVVSERAARFGGLPAAVFIPMTVALAIFCAIALHKVVERPRTHWLVGAIHRRGMPITAVPLTREASLMRHEER